MQHDLTARVGALARMLLLCSLTIPALAQERPVTTSDYFYSFGKRVAQEIALDRIGVLVADDERRDVLEQLRQRNLDPVAQYPRIVICRVPRAASSRAIVRLAREMERRERELMLQAGLVATPQRSEIPMIVRDQFIVRLKPDSKLNIKDLAAHVGAVAVVEDPFDKGKFPLRIKPDSRNKPCPVGAGKVQRRDPTVACYKRLMTFVGDAA